MSRLEGLSRCFQGVLPSIMATCSADGQPNVTFLSQVHYVDAQHVALSCQFFNKTRRNVLENPYASVLLFDPLTFDSYKLKIRFLRAETSGPLFEQLALRIDAIASHTGMKGVFRLLAADVYQVLDVELVEPGVPPEFVGSFPALPDTDPEQPWTELKGLQVISERINRATSLDALLSSVLDAVCRLMRVEHAMVLLKDEASDKLFAVDSRGYGENGAGAEVLIGDGLIGTVAEQMRPLRVVGVAGELRYGRAIRQQFARGGEALLLPEIPLPGLPDAQSQLAFPLVVQNRLVGVLAVESRDPLRFADWHEAFLGIIGNQVAIGIVSLTTREEPDADPPPESKSAPAPPTGPRRSFCLYRHDDCVFVDNEYLIRNVPGKILWKILTEYASTGRTEFSNREMRLDVSLGLPPVKDNLESRLILLRKRLEQKCPDVRLVPTRRGRFELEIRCQVELHERSTP